MYHGVREVEGKKGNSKKIPKETDWNSVTPGFGY